MTSRRNGVLALLLALSQFGCASLWYELQPKRLKKLNSGPAPSIAPEFSSRSPYGLPALVRRDRSAKPAAITANSAEVSFARGQNADF